MFTKMTEMLKKSPKKLVFPEGEDLRILSAAVRLRKDGLVEPILLGNPQVINARAAENGLDIAGIELVDPVASPRFGEMAEELTELRRGKMGADECANAIRRSNYFGTMMVKMGLADGLLGGATYSTADTVRPALQIVKTKPGHSIVSSCFIMNRETEAGAERYVMADCAINMFPTEDEVVEIALETAEMAALFGMEPRVALLSYGTKGSGKGESPEKMRNAAKKLQAMNLGYPVDGELQFDAAFSPEVAGLKAPGSPLGGRANTFIFPDINAGNIGYKIAQRLGGFEAIGPILLGLKAPINDLSRGSNAEEVYKMAIVTAATAID